MAIPNCKKRRKDAIPGRTDRKSTDSVKRSGNVTVDNGLDVWRDARFRWAEWFTSSESSPLRVLFQELNRIVAGYWLGPDVVVSTFAGSGEVGLVDGIGTNATLSDPRGMVLDPANNRIVFADGNAIRAISIATGGVSTVVGSSEKGCSSGRCKVAKLSHPMDVAIDPTDGTVVVIDDNHIWRIDEKTDSVHAIAASENRDVKSTWLRAQPWGLCCDAKGNLGKNSFSVSTIAGNGKPGDTDGKALKRASFRLPTALRNDPRNEKIIYVACHRSLRKLDLTSGLVSTIKLKIDHELNDPRGIAVSTVSGLLYVTSSGTGSLYCINSKSGATERIVGPNDRPSALVWVPWGIVLDELAGVMFVSDSHNHRICKMAGAIPPSPYPT